MAAVSYTLPRVRQYRVREVFLTLQGEGQWSGSRAVFVRFTGCNVWSGHERHRERDTAKGFCAAWCDTEFRDTKGPGGGTYDAETLAEAVEHAWGLPDTRCRLVVLTGGEPSLQVDDALVHALHRRAFRVHMETNGSHGRLRSLDWATLSPKPPMEVVVDGPLFDEVKVVLAPGVDPEHYWHLSRGPCWIQPCDYGALDEDQNAKSLRDATAYAMAHPDWRLCLQTHKLAGIP